MHGLHEKAPRCSGTRTLRRVALVAPATVLMTLAFGSTGAFAAPGGNAAAHSNAGGNGNGVAKGLDKQSDTSMSSSSGSSSSATSTSTNTTAAPAAASTTSATTTAASTTASSSSSSTASSDNNGSAPVQHGAAACPDPTNPLCSPQPNSGADQNSGGANGQCTDPKNLGPYCSTRDGSASGNGNGNGQAVGKPCAGCVGKADNKNPHGQMPNGSDHNAGYECDRNHGIGRTNPAHTGCKTPPSTCPTGTVRQPDGSCKTPTPDCTTNPTPDCHHGGGDDCTAHPEKPECQHHDTDCTTNPNQSKCQHTTPDCTTNPTASGCQHTTPDCTTNPTASGCQQTSENCATNPSAAGCTNGGKTTCVPTAENSFCSTVEGEKVVKTPTKKPTKTPTKVVGERVVKTPTTTLPFTGANVALLLASGFGGLGLGSVLLAAAGRRSKARA